MSGVRSTQRRIDLARSTFHLVSPLQYRQALTILLFARLPFHSPWSLALCSIILDCLSFFAYLFSPSLPPPPPDDSRALYYRIVLLGTYLGIHGRSHYRIPTWPPNRLHHSFQPTKGSLWSRLPRRVTRSVLAARWSSASKTTPCWSNKVLLMTVPVPPHTHPVPRVG